MRLWIDDLRDPKDFVSGNDTWIWVKDSSTAIAWLNKAMQNEWTVEAVSFDHDLGGDDTTRPVVNWMCENEWWPKRCYVHSMNPIGRNYLIGTINRYGPGVSNNG